MFRAQAILLFTLSPGLLTAEVEEEIPLGLEVVTGVRSDYVYRGFNLAGTTLDAQVEGEVTLAQDLFLNLGGWLASEMSGNFSEAGAYAELRHDFSDSFALGGGFTHVARDMAPIGDTSEAALFLQYFPTGALDFKFLAGREFETSGWYSSLESGWSQRFSDDAFFLLTNGVSWGDDFHGRDGWNDYYGRLSLTYALSQTISITPYAGWSVLLQDHGGAGDSVFAGFWFEVFF